MGSYRTFQGVPVLSVFPDEGMDNNPLTYIMMTPNLDAMGHQWVGALVWFNFELEYQ